MEGGLFRQGRSSKKKNPIYTSSRGFSNNYVSENAAPSQAGSFGSYEVSHSESTLQPPKQRYGVRIRQRQDFPCDDPSQPQYVRLCANLKKQGKVVECGDKRFR